MVSKCANPGCQTPFLYLHAGKLFRLETDAGDVEVPSFGTDPTIKKPPRRVECFWLCSECAAVMTLTFKKGAGVTTKPLARAQTAAS
jgi:hypothetical protein